MTLTRRMKLYYDVVPSAFLPNKGFFFKFHHKEDLKSTGSMFSQNNYKLNLKILC